MGKTEAGALWLSPQRTSPYLFYQYWINLDDADVGQCLRFFTDLDRQEVDAVLGRARPRPRPPPGTAAPGRRPDPAGPRAGRARHGRSGPRRFSSAEKSPRSPTPSSTEIFADVPSRQLPRDRLAAKGWA